MDEADKAVQAAIKKCPLSTLLWCPIGFFALLATNFSSIIPTAFLVLYHFHVEPFHQVLPWVADCDVYSYVQICHYNQKIHS